MLHGVLRATPRSRKEKKNWNNKEKKKGRRTQERSAYRPIIGYSLNIYLQDSDHQIGSNGSYMHEMLLAIKRELCSLPFY